MSQNNKPDNDTPSSSLAIAAIQATIKQLLSEGRIVKIEHSDVDGLVIRIPSLDVVKVDGKRRIVDASTPVVQVKAKVEEPCSSPQ